MVGTHIETVWYRSSRSTLFEHFVMHHADCFGYLGRNQHHHLSYDGSALELVTIEILLVREAQSFNFDGLAYDDHTTLPTLC